MDTMRAFAMGELNRGKELMVFDWDKAATLIKERKPSTASAGLAGQIAAGIASDPGSSGVDKSARRLADDLVAEMEKGE